jgi:hypothetical protein
VGKYNGQLFSQIFFKPLCREVGEFPRVPDLLRSAEKSEGPSDRAPFLLVRFLWASKENEQYMFSLDRWNLSEFSTRSEFMIKLIKTEQHRLTPLH